MTRPAHMRSAISFEMGKKKREEKQTEKNRYALKIELKLNT